MQKNIELIKTQASFFAEEENLKLFSVAFVNDRTGRILRVNLDGDVTLDKCANISRKLSKWLDGQAEGFVPYKSYSLEVSSLGLDRPLSSREDFASQMNKLCKVQTKSKDDTGRRNYKGIIKKVDEDSITLHSDEEKADFTIALNNIKKANLEIEF